MKRAFSLLILLFVVPFKKIKTLFKDNFLSGLIIGAIFSLLVNLISMQVQGLVDKQRVLEAIENEIISNSIHANGLASTALTQRKNKEKANIFLLPQKFSRDLWEQSIEPIQYVAQLNSKQQILINSYYTFTVPFNNQMIDLSNKQFIDSNKECFDFNKILSKVAQQECNENYYSFLDNIALYPGKMTGQAGFEVLDDFHPTQDRLKSPLLRFLMGSESMKVLSGK